MHPTIRGAVRGRLNVGRPRPHHAQDGQIHESDVQPGSSHAPNNKRQWGAVLLLTEPPSIGATYSVLSYPSSKMDPPTPPYWPGCLCINAVADYFKTREYGIAHGWWQFNADGRIIKCCCHNSAVSVVCLFTGSQIRGGLVVSYKKSS